MQENQFESVYKAFRQTAYRLRYESALLFGRRDLTYGALLTRAEYAYNTFCQMGIEPGQRVCLWLPNCPDLLTSFYGLARLGAIPVLAHPVSSARELYLQMRTTDARALITTADRYRDYCGSFEPLPASALVLCKPEADLSGKEKAAYLKGLRSDVAEEEGYAMDELLKENQYRAGDLPFEDGEQCAAVLFGTSSFLQPKAILYSAEELQFTADAFWHHRERLTRIYVEPSFATEGGFLAVHSALCGGKTVIWTAGDAFPVLKKHRPDFLVATEEFYWRLRQEGGYFKGKWSTLQGGIQIGKDLTSLTEKFTPRAFEAVGGKGLLTGSPVPLKTKKEALYYVGDFGVRTADVERELSRLEGIAKCQCLPEEGGLRLKILPNGTEAAKQLGRQIVSHCNREMNPRHLPQKVEFCPIL